MQHFPTCIIPVEAKCRDGPSARSLERGIMTAPTI
jgi:hypothetical protein